LQEEEKGLHTYLVPGEKEAREVDGRARNWAAFYSHPSLLQAQMHH